MAGMGVSDRACNQNFLTRLNPITVGVLEVQTLTALGLLASA